MCVSTRGERKEGGWGHNLYSGVPTIGWWRSQDWIDELKSISLTFPKPLGMLDGCTKSTLSEAQEPGANTVTYSALISACEKWGKWEWALELVK